MSAHDEPHLIPFRTYLAVFIALMVLLVVTVVVAFMPLGSLALAIAMVIASIKAVLIIMYFMHVKFSTRLTWIFSGAAFFWLAIMVLVTGSDYFSRGWLYVAGK